VHSVYDAVASEKEDVNVVGEISLKREGGKVEESERPH
jgi:hypothetical protein